MDPNRLNLTLMVALTLTLMRGEPRHRINPPLEASKRVGARRDTRTEPPPSQIQRGILTSQSDIDPAYITLSKALTLIHDRKSKAFPSPAGKFQRERQKGVGNVGDLSCQ